MFFLRRLLKVAPILCCLLTAPIFSYDEEVEELFIPSTPEQIVSLSSEMDSLVGGVLSPLSGQPVLRETDLVVKGAQDIVLSRTYIPPYMPCSFGKHKHHQGAYDKCNRYDYLLEHYKGWQFYPHLRLKVNLKTMSLLLTEPSGITLSFNLSGHNYSVATLSSFEGISNAAGETPSGKYDPRNTQISCEEEGARIVVLATDGVIRSYVRVRRLSGPEYLYLLEKEILPNGKVVRYLYNQDLYLDRVESLDPKEQFIYASLQVEGNPWDKYCRFTASSGLTVNYKYHLEPLHVKIKEVKKHRLGKEKWTRNVNRLHPPTLIGVNSPRFQFEEIQYSNEFLIGTYLGKHHEFKAYHGKFGGGELHYRVNHLSLPVGPNSEFNTVYEFDYHPPIPGEQGGSTTVKNSDGTSLVYHFSKDLLITAIQHFGQEGQLKKEKVFSWDENHWLKSVAVRDGHNHTLYQRSFEFDAFGNPIVEVFSGDLTGEGSEETWTTWRTFSEEGRHLLLREENQEGKVVCFTYLPGTDLVTSKLTQEGEKILLREFFVYDDCHNLVQRLVDDGVTADKDDLSQVTERQITTYHLRQEAPFLHLPEWIEESYLENGTEKLLKKTHRVYNPHGEVAEEAVYDASGAHAYTLFKTYNKRGDLLTETNRLGQKAISTYNMKGQMESHLNFSNRLETAWLYDDQGRIKTKIEKGDDGIVHKTFSEYDFHDRKIWEQDPFGNQTRYTQDLIANKVVKTDFPPILSIEGEPLPVATGATYDPLGRELTLTDANGNTTCYRRNAYGAPTEIIYPQGGREVFRYTKGGQLSDHTDLDGLTTHYERDIFGRVLVKTYFSSSNTLIAKETFTYNAFHLLTETDKESHTQYYAYDGAGRKIQEAFCSHVTDFYYDGLSRIAAICKRNGDNSLFIHYERDLEGQILEERKTDSSGKLLYKINYSYDRDGNVATTTRSVHGEAATQARCYDSLGRLIEEKDPLGHVTKIYYCENHLNSLGQKTLQRATTDPHGVTTLETKDPFSRTIRQEILSAKGERISCDETFRDPHGNLLYRIDHRYEKGRLLGSQTVYYTHTPDHQIASLTRAFGTFEARMTHYTYFPSGKIATKTLPDGVTLTHQYDPLGFVSRLDSSDGTIHHAFGYNLLGDLLYASDENQNIVIRREVDPFGNVVREIFPQGLEVESDYDAFHRRVYLRMGDQGEVFYTYDPLFLRKVARISPHGELLYEHTYQEYDTGGNLLAENLIGNVGQVLHTTDLRGQKTSISSPYFSEDCEYDAVGNLLACRSDGVQSAYFYDDLSQLSSEKSPRYSLNYAHDSLHNRTQKNEKPRELNALNELLSSEGGRCAYNLNGDQILRQTSSGTTCFAYDPLHRLVEATSEDLKVVFTHDPLGRRLSKRVLEAQLEKEISCEYYLYEGQNEIGAFTTSNEPINLRVLGLAKHKNCPLTVGIEIADSIAAPLIDVQGNIRRLVEVDAKAVTDFYDFTAFGEALYPEVPSLNPWRFASKRFDPELGVVYFGERYYDPFFGKWLTTDPAGFVDSVNLYQYVFNNPFRYKDPDGKFVVALPLLGLAWKALAVAAVTTCVLYQLEHQHPNSSFERGFNAVVHQIVQNIGGVPLYAANQCSISAHRKKQGREDPNPKYPEDLEKDPKWQEVSHPDQKEAGHREFENTQTGEKIRFDKGKPNKPGHEGHDHHHHMRPNPQGDYDCLDETGKVVRPGSDAAHLYNPENVWWRNR